MTMRKVQLVLAVIILVVSLIVLAWGIWPAAHERRTLGVSPTEMTLPTPSSFEPSLTVDPLAGLHLPCSDAVA